MTRDFHFCLLALADVNNGRQNRQPFRCVNRVETDFDWDFTPVFTPPVEVAPCPHWPTLGIPKITVSMLCIMRPESFGNKYLDSLANEFIPCIGKEGLDPFVYKDDLPVFVTMIIALGAASSTRRNCSSASLRLVMSI